MPLLFSQANIFDVLRHREAALKAEVNGLGSPTLNQVPEKELVRDLASKYKIEVLILEDEKAYTSYREVDVDVSQDPMGGAHEYRHYL